MELMHQLTPKLKQLRLSGVLETLDVRHRQAIDSQWTHVEFLARLLEDEVERRAQKQLALRTRRATVNTAKTLENYDFAFNPMVKRAQVLQLASCDYIRQKQNVLVCGPTGVGKSHLAQALGHDCLLYTSRAHETVLDLVCRLLLEKKKTHKLEIAFSPTSNYRSALHMIQYTYSTICI